MYEDDDYPVKRQVRLTIPALAVLLVLVLAGMGGMFALGLWVGRDTNTVEVQAEDVGKLLDELVAEAAKERIAETEDRMERTAGRSEVYLSLEERESGSVRGPAPTRVTPSPEAAPASPAPEVEPAPKSPGPAAAPASPAPAPGPAPVSPALDAEPTPETPVPEAEPAPKDKPEKAASQKEEPGYETVAWGAWSIQVAAFEKPEDSKKAMERYQKRGFPTYEVKVEREGRPTIYRVRVGPFGTKEYAQKVRKDLLPYSPGAFVVKR
ncbi:MAG: SPOR domain-containing protein [Deltaproteobacteria bacterium]|nr:SPOR domain-containing protein [Deltaproteobacteria bacterium]